MNTFIPYISDKSGSELRYMIGDATNPQKLENEIAIIPHVCNNLGGWGAGFVLAVSKKWANPEQQYRGLFSKPCPISPENALGNIQLVGVEDDVVVLNMIAQNGYKREDNPKPIQYAELVKCMRRAVADITKRGWNENQRVSFHCPQFGAGLAGGKWSIIEELIKEIWVDAGFDVTIYLFDDGKNKILLPNSEGRCPNCGEDTNLQFGDTDYNNGVSWQNCNCLNEDCEVEFEDVYVYSHTEFRPK